MNHHDYIPKDSDDCVYDATFVGTDFAFSKGNTSKARKGILTGIIVSSISVCTIFLCYSDWEI